MIAHGRPSWLAAALLGIIAGAGCRRQSAPPAPAPEFSPAVKVNDGTGEFGQAEPSIVADENGNLVVAWMDWGPPRPSIRMAISTNGGASFSASRAVHQPDPSHPDGQADPTLVKTEEGEIHLAWLACRDDAENPSGRACDVHAKVSGDGGKSWSAPTPVAAGGPVKRDRPWLATDGLNVAASWTEETAEGARWVVAFRTTSGSYSESGSVPRRAGILPPALTAARGLEALLVDRSDKDPLSIVLDRVRSRDEGRSFQSLGDVRFDRRAVLLDYSLGAFAVAEDGASWIAMPRGSGVRNDLLLAHRAASLDAYRTGTGLREAASGRVGLPWIEPLANGRFLAAWLEEVPEGGRWRVMARFLGPGMSRSASGVVTPEPFGIQPASRKKNVGDFLDLATAGNRVWIAWSDTRHGTADIYVSSATLE